MMRDSQKRVSLVIPAYNEENSLRDCLDAVARQTVRPSEVIVVDNNSIDGTAKIARSYPFVRVVREQRQGVVFARNAGFNAAKGEIIGRIDADTHLPPDWIATVQAIFADGSVDAVSGSVAFYDAPFGRFFSALDSMFRRYLARNLERRGELFLYGGNMAVSREFWRGLRGETCLHRHQHEDVDLAAHAALASYKIVFSSELRAFVSAQRIDTPLRVFIAYSFSNVRIYRKHGLRGRIYMYPIIWFAILLYPFARPLYRGYDARKRRFSFLRMFSAPSARVSPIS